MVNTWVPCSICNGIREHAALAEYKKGRKTIYLCSSCNEYYNGQ